MTYFDHLIFIAITVFGVGMLLLGMGGCELSLEEKKRLFCLMWLLF